MSFFKRLLPVKSRAEKKPLAVENNQQIDRTPTKPEGTYDVYPTENTVSPLGSPEELSQFLEYQSRRFPHNLGA